MEYRFQDLIVLAAGVGFFIHDDASSALGGGAWHEAGFPEMGFKALRDGDGQDLMMESFGKTGKIIATAEEQIVGLAGVVDAGGLRQAREPEIQPVGTKI